jgi:hypothetical protein
VLQRTTLPRLACGRHERLATLTDGSEHWLMMCANAVSSVACEQDANSTYSLKCWFAKTTKRKGKDRRKSYPASLTRTMVIDDCYCTTTIHERMVTAIQDIENKAFDVRLSIGCEAFSTVNEGDH